jgi:hypothetical protein
MTRHRIQMPRLGSNGVRRLLGVLMTLAMIASLIPAGVANGATLATFTLSGTVKTEGGALLPGALVRVHEATSLVVQGTPITNSSGIYSIRVPQGSYKLWINPNKTGFASFWYGGTSAQTATAIVVQANTIVNLTVPRIRFTLSGTVKTSAGTILPGALVNVYDSTGTVGKGVATANASGVYSIALVPGTYKLKINPSSPGFPVFWYGGTTAATATAIVIGTANKTLNIVVAIPRYVLSGTVKASTGAILPGAVVRAVDATTLLGKGNVAANASGVYSITLAVGIYKLQILPVAPGPASFWYGGTSAATATPVQLFANKTLNLIAPKPPDTTPPGPVTGLTATPAQTEITLAWTKPTAADFAGVTIRRAQGPTAPATVTSGDAVTSLGASAVSYLDTGRTRDTQYSYSVFAKDGVPNYAAAASVTTRTLPPTLVSIAVTPANPSNVAGTSRQFVATGTYSNATTADISSTVTWTSADTAVATLSAAGLASALTVGTSTITATLGTIHGATDLTVTPAPDTTAPGPVTDLTATPYPTQVTLSWTNPTDTDFAGVTIRRAQGSTPPATVTDGDAVASLGATATSYLDSSLPSSTDFSYAFFARDAVPNYAVAATVSTQTPALTGTRARTETPRTTPETCFAMGFVAIPDVPGVQYSDNTFGWGDLTPGIWQFPADVPFVITAAALPGFYLEGPTIWTLTIAPADFNNCPVQVDVTPPSVSNQTCSATGFITIPDVLGVDYFIDGSLVPAGTKDRSPNTYTISAQPQSGFAFFNPAGPWIVNIAPAQCPAQGISFVGVTSSRSGSGPAAAVDLPAGWQPGDTAIVLAVRKNNEGTIPTAPVGWTLLQSTAYGVGPDGLSVLLASRVLQAGDGDTASDWVDANNIQLAVYRNVSSIGIPVDAFTGSLAPTITFPALGNLTANSWAVGIGEHYMFASDANIVATDGTATRTGMSGTPETLVLDSNGAVASWAQHATRNLPSSGVSIGYSLELVALP